MSLSISFFCFGYLFCFVIDGLVTKKHVSFFSHVHCSLSKGYPFCTLYICFASTNRYLDTGSIYKGIKCSLLISWSGSTSPANPSNDIHCMGLCVYAMLHVYAAAIRKKDRNIGKPPLMEKKQTQETKNRTAVISCNSDPKAITKSWI